MIVDIGNYKKTIFIAGSGRSGTTWLMELINRNNEYRLEYLTLNLFIKSFNLFSSLYMHWGNGVKKSLNA